MSFAALELLKNAISKAGYTDKIVIGMDVAASEFYKGGKYDLDFKSPDDPSRYITPDQLADLYKSFVKDYPGQLPSLIFSAAVCVHIWYTTVPWEQLAEQYVSNEYRSRIFLKKVYLDVLKMTCFFDTDQNMKSNGGDDLPPWG